ncbi:MAG: hypothetical protein HQL13_01185 [Candidatus Omnitrophica bacterium]|nr:hypothetical protein [Candidatus Omnitrophota bacterium]
MENKKVNVSVGIIVIVLLLLFCVLSNVFYSSKVSTLKEYTAVMAQLIKENINTIKSLSDKLAVKEKENQDLKNTLANTRNALEALSNKFAKPSAPDVSIGR